MIVLYFIINKEKTNQIKQSDDMELFENNSFYSKHVEPIFIKNCIACHHDKKKLGGLNMLSPSKIHLGGKNGSVITIGPALYSQPSTISNTSRKYVPADIFETSSNKKDI